MVIGSRRATIARRYARAYLRVYKELLTAVDIENIKQFGALLKNHAALVYLAVLSLSAQHKEHLVTTMLTQCSVHASFKQVVTLLMQQNRLELLPIVIVCIVEEYTIAHSPMQIDVATSSTLTQEQEKFINSKLAALFNMTIQTKFTVDTTLIYGMRLRSRLLLFDNSVARKLKEAQQELLRQVEI